MVAFSKKVERLPFHSTKGRQRWLEARRHGVGASEVSAIMGVSEYDGPLSIYERKVGALADDDINSEAAVWGHLFERPILLEYARRTGRPIRMGGQLLRSRDNPHWLVTLDAEQNASAAPSWASGTGIGECKTTGFGQVFKDETPAHVQIQQQYQMMVTGAEWSTCVWLPFPERTLGYRDSEPHPAFQEQMAAEVDEFWRRVELRDPPAPNAMDSARNALRRLYPDLSQSLVLFRGVDAVELAEEVAQIKEAKKKLDERKKLIENVMLASMKKHKWAMVDDGRYWSQSSIAERDELCPHCDGVVRHVKASKRIGLYGPSPRKKFPEAVTGELDPAPPDDDLVALLEQSLLQLQSGD